MERRNQPQVVAEMIIKLADKLSHKNFMIYRDHICLLKALAITIKTEHAFDMESFFKHYFNERYSPVVTAESNDLN